MRERDIEREEEEADRVRKRNQKGRERIERSWVIRVTAFGEP